MKPSTDQKRVFDFALDPDAGSAVCNAVAGSGKTTTLKMTAETIGRDVLVVCFGREIREELERVMPANARCMTLHSAGNRAWGLPRSAIAAGEPGRPSKTDRIISMLQGQGGPLPSGAQPIPRWVPRGKIRRLVKMAKDEGIVPADLLPGSPEMLPGLTPDDDATWSRLIAHYGLELTDRTGRLTEAMCIGNAREVLRWSVRYARQVIDLDDQLYMPTLAAGFSFPTEDWVFCDELQDVSVLQREMILRMVAAGGRFLGVGDRNQAIFGWRGADVESMARVKAMTRARDLELNVCYRCPKAVVELAQEYVPHIEAAPWAEEGIVEELETFKASDLRPGAMVLCRMRAPAIQLAYRLLGHGTPVRITGGSGAAKGLVSFVESLVEPRATVAELLHALDRWASRKLSEAAAREDEDAMAEATDKQDTIVAIAEGSRSKDVAELTARIDDLFVGPREGRVLCGTIHGAKGLEADEVWALDDHLQARAKLPWQVQQERNLQYVKITRARKALRFIRSEGLR